MVEYVMTISLLLMVITVCVLLLSRVIIVLNNMLTHVSQVRVRMAGHVTILISPFFVFVRLVFKGIIVKLRAQTLVVHLPVSMEEHASQMNQQKHSNVIVLPNGWEYSVIQKFLLLVSHLHV